jgi:hypothetical protein
MNRLLAFSFVLSSCRTPGLLALALLRRPAQ